MFPHSPRCSRTLRFEQLEARQVLSANLVTLYPVADTFTQSGVNAGTQTTLTTRDLSGNDSMAYLRFDLAGVDLTGITNAYFTLTMTSGATMTEDRFDVYGLSNLPGNTPQNWNETTLANAGLGAEYTTTAGNYLDVTRVFNLNEDGTAPADVIEQVTANGSKQILQGVDLVNFLAARKADGGLATLIVQIDAGQDRTFTYGSRENANVAFRPTLQLEYLPPSPAVAVEFPQQVDHLDRGLVVMRRATNEAYIGWRMLGTDPTNVSFNVYRSANGGAATKINATPISNSTNFVDNASTGFNNAATNVYTVRPIIAGVERAATESFTLPASAPIRQYLNLPLQIPPSVQQPDVANPGQFVTVTYAANDGSAADLDGDGQYEIIVKWMPSNEAHAGADGFTGPMIFDAYKLDGTRLWRINLGINIRSAPQYSAFTVYDFDGDGISEFVSRTMPGTVDGLGTNVILPGDNPAADYRNSTGRILTGPEYLTVFNGVTGAAMATVPYTPDRQNIATWGDDYGHRGENVLLAPAYLDGNRPSIVVGRGIFGPSSGFDARNELTAWDYRNGQLTQRWWFKADVGIDNVNSNYVGQGVYNMIPADVDGDGKDEIVYGAMVVDDDGTGLYSTGRSHGDALHVSDMDLTNPGLEIFMPSESSGVGNHRASFLRDGATGRILAGPYVSAADVAAGTFPDVGRGVALDIDPNHPGYEFWDSYSPSIYDAQGNAIYAKPSNMHQNFGVWWDADLSRETLDNTTIGNWVVAADGLSGGRSNLVSFANSGINSSAGLSANNGTKSTPTLSGDILGDWREEVIWRTSDNTALQIWSTTTTSTNKLYTLTHDVQYREAIAWQNVGYNQPPHPSYFLGTGMAAQVAPWVYSIQAGGNAPGDFNGDLLVDGDDLRIWSPFYGQSSTAGVQPGDGTGDRAVDGGDFLAWQRNLGAATPSAQLALAANAVSVVAAAPPAPLDDLSQGAIAIAQATAMQSTVAAPATTRAVPAAPVQATSAARRHIDFHNLGSSSTTERDRPATPATTNRHRIALHELDAAFGTWDAACSEEPQMATCTL